MEDRKKGQYVNYGDREGYSEKKESATPSLNRLYTKLSNIVNMQVENVSVIENKLHDILNNKIPDPSGEAEPLKSVEFPNGGIVTELEVQINHLSVLNDRLLSIVQHLNTII